MISKKIPKLLNGKRIICSTNGAGNTAYAKNEFGHTYLTPYTHKKIVNPQNGRKN